MLAFFLNMYTLDYLPNHIDIKLYQHKKMFRINTDTCLLGEFLDFKPNLSVLDIGTNNSALLLYSSLLKPKNMVGIDINNEALEIAKRNLDMNNVINYKLIDVDASNFISEDKFDVIISNPPYFVSSEDLKNNELKIKNSKTKEEDIVSLDTLIYYLDENLMEDDDSCSCEHGDHDCSCGGNCHCNH
jgi:tRNA1(Val) A37 N6-methylase TrmN6